MNGRTNAKNGAGAIRNGCAVLEVRAPAYSQITAVRADGLTKRQSKGYIDLSNNNFWFYYIIIQKFELSNLIWTVTATGTYSVTATVLIDSNGQYDITIPVPLYYEGTYYNDISGGFEARARRYDSGSAQAKVPTITDYSNYFNFYLYNGAGAYITRNPVDLSEFSNLKFIIYGKSPSDAGIRLGVTSRNTGFYSSDVLAESPNIVTTVDKFEVNVDISNVNGSGYVQIFASKIDNYNNVDVYEISLS